MRKLSAIFYVLFIVAPFTVFSQFSPRDIGGLQLWVSSDTGIVLSGSNVTTWQDRSGNNNHLVSGGADPLFVSTVGLLNDLPAVRFNGTSNFLLENNSLTIGTAFIISNWQGGGTDFPSYNGLITKTSATSPQYIFISNQGTSNFYAAFPYTSFGTNVFKNSIPSYDYSPLADYKVTSAIDTIPDVYPSIEVGNNPLDPSSFWNGDIAEIIIYDSPLTTTERLEVEQYFYDKYSRPEDLGPDVTMSVFCDTAIDAGARFKDFLWSTGATTQTITVTTSGTYFVSVVDIFDVASFDTINVNLLSIHELPLHNSICLGDSILWNTNLSSNSYSFSWSTGDTTSSIYIKTDGQFWVTVTDSLGCFKTSDTINVAVDSFPVFASLGGDSINLCVGNTIGLVQGASQASSYNWLLGGETTSTLHILTSGTYYLSVIDTNGCSKTDSIYANIVGLPPVAHFLSTSVCEGGVTQFTDSSYDPTIGNSVVSWFWDFGDNTTDNVQNPSHTYSTFGNHSVILTVISNYGCPDNDTAIAFVHALPTASFINTNPCANVSTQFNSTSFIDPSSFIANYLWNFGDPSSGMNNTSGQPNPGHSYTNTTNYVVSLITTSNFGCSDTAVDVLVVRPSSTPNFQYLPTCYGSLVQFTNLSLPAGLDSAWQWNFGDGPGFNSLENPTHLYGIAQDWNVTLTIYSYGGCVTSATKPVTVSPLPIAAFVHSPACVGVPYQFLDSSHVSSGTITGWEWHFAGLDSSYVQNPFFTFPDTGNYSITLKVTSDIGSGVGCTGSLARTIHVNPLPVANFSFNPPFGNPPLPVSFFNLTTNVNANTYQWDFGDSATSSLINPQHLYTDTNLFPIQLIAITPFGCKDTALKNIYVIKPILDLSLTGLSSSYILDNHLHIIVDLANLGTQPINKFKIEARLADGTPVEEPFVQTLPNGYSGQLELSSSLDLESGLAKYYCVSAVKPNDVDDDVLRNNEICKDLTNEFIVVNPYPNPFNDHLFFQLILPYKDDISIEVFDLVGKKITVYEGPGQEGSNLFEADLSDLSNGSYAVRFKFRETEIIKTIVKAERKN